MLVENQLIEVVVGIKTKHHYNNLGYNVKIGDTIYVPPEHLTSGSHAVVQVVCDVCKKPIPRPYKEYIQKHTYDMDCCMECKYIKAKQTNLVVYGSENPAQAKEIKEKMKMTNLRLYGVEYASSSKGIKNKRKITAISKYGVENVMQSSVTKEKQRETMLNRYGVENPMQVEEIKEKARETNVLKYGVENVMQNPEINAKARQTLQNNGSCPTSKQQLAVYEMVKQKYSDAELNYPFSTLSLDIYICVDGVKITIEYDGSYWHNDQQRDIKRDKYLQSQGFKVLRIRSGHLLPTEEQLFAAIDELVTTNRKFKEIKLKDWREPEPKIEEEVV